MPVETHFVLHTCQHHIRSNKKKNPKQDGRLILAAAASILTVTDGHWRPSRWLSDCGNCGGVWGVGGPICHLKSGRSPMTEIREKISFSHKRILHHLYNCIWFLRSDNSKSSCGHRAVVYSSLYLLPHAVSQWHCAQDFRWGTREQNQMWAEKSWFEETRILVLEQEVLIS